MAPGRFRMDCYMNVHTFWEPFWHRWFLNFFTNGENHEFIAQGIVSEGSSIPKPFICHAIFHWLFMFFPKPPQQNFLGTRSTSLCWKVRFWNPFQISMGSQSSRGAPFSRKRVFKSPTFPAQALREEILRPRPYISFLFILDGCWNEFCGFKTDVHVFFKTFTHFCMTCSTKCTWSVPNQFSLEKANKRTSQQANTPTRQNSFDARRSARGAFHL